MPKLDARKISIFYEYKATGFSETLYTRKSLPDAKALVMPYLKVRLPFADDDMQAHYARISDMNNPRSTDFLDLIDTPGTRGLTKVAGCSPTDVVLLKTTATGGRSSHFFIHAFPASFLHEDKVVFTGTWGDQVKAWGDFMSSVANDMGFLNAFGNSVANRVAIANAVGQHPRGFIMTVASVAGLNVGDTVVVGGTSKDGVGYSGRKQIIAIDTVAKTITVGGAKPVGDLGLNAYFCKLSYTVVHMNQIQPVKLTERKVGRIFGQPVGRRAATLSLRR